MNILTAADLAAELSDLAIEDADCDNELFDMDVFRERAGLAAHKLWQHIPHNEMGRLYEAYRAGGLIGSPEGEMFSEANAYVRGWEPTLYYGSISDRADQIADHYPRTIRPPRR